MVYDGISLATDVQRLGDGGWESGSGVVKSKLTYFQRVSEGETKGQCCLWQPRQPQWQHWGELKLTKESDEEESISNNWSEAMERRRTWQGFYKCKYKPDVMVPWVRSSRWSDKQLVPVQDLPRSEPAQIHFRFRSSDSTCLLSFRRSQRISAASYPAN